MGTLILRSKIRDLDLRDVSIEKQILTVRAQNIYQWSNQIQNELFAFRFCLISCNFFQISKPKISTIPLAVSFSVERQLDSPSRIQN